MRSILHVDLNAFYASVEQAMHPELQGLPVAVAGDMERRNGVLLTSSYEARARGVKTAMTIGEAKRICPDLILIKPNYSAYMKYSLEVMNILKIFSPEVEQFSIDEAWVDVTGSWELYGDPSEIADRIRGHIRSKLKITASVGVSYCKLVSKMASDFKKPDGTSVIMQRDIPRMIWPLPIESLIGVGKKTSIKLREMGIFTIGDMANTFPNVLERRFGKIGSYLWGFANGIDDSEVTTLEDEIKGIGNSITTPRDMVNLEEASEIVMALCESVAKRMREQGLEGNVVELVIKTCDFNSYVRQRKIYNYTDITYEIYNEALRLLCDNWDRRIALRLLGVRVSGLRPASGIRQISFFDEDIMMKNQRLDRCMDKIRDKHGYNSILRAALMVNGSRDIMEIENPGDEENITLNRGRMS